MNDATMLPARVLLIEDEDHLAAGLKLNFELEGYQVERARTGRDAARLLVECPAFDILVLDIMLPDIDGFAFCERLREGGDRTPVLMLTARNSIDDRVRGLEVGADDYLPKPFELAELLARMQSLMRRQAWERSDTAHHAPPLRISDVEIDFDRAQVHRGTEVLHLTKLEFDLVKYFSEHPHRVLSREELQQQVWKLQDYPNRRMVDNFILRLRRHFEPDPQNPRYFVSVRGAGYKFVPNPE